MLRKFLLAGAFCVMTATTANTAQADVANLFNTGVDSTKTQLNPYGANQDSHYTVGYVADGTPNNSTASVSDYANDATLRAQVASAATVGLTFTLPQGQYPVTAYVPNTASTKSDWITDTDGHVNNPANSRSPGFYIFQTSFDVASAQTLMGKWSSDNQGVDILLDGVSIHPTMTPNNQFQLPFASFPDASLAVGHHTLDFVVYNEYLAAAATFNPVALRVEMTAIPEPAYAQMSALLLGGGLMGLRLRKKQKAA